MLAPGPANMLVFIPAACSTLLSFRSAGYSGTTRNIRCGRLFVHASVCQRTSAWAKAPFTARLRCCHIFTELQENVAVPLVTLAALDTGLPIFHLPMPRVSLLLCQACSA